MQSRDLKEGEKQGGEKWCFTAEVYGRSFTSASQQTHSGRHSGLFYQQLQESWMQSNHGIFHLSNTATQRNLQDLCRPAFLLPPLNGTPLSPQRSCRASVTQPCSCHVCRCHGDTFLPAMPGERGTRGKAFPPPLTARPPCMCPQANPDSQVERYICVATG